MKETQLKALALVACMGAYKLSFSGSPKEQCNLTTDDILNIPKDSISVIDFLRDKGFIKTESKGDDNYKITMTAKGWKEFGRCMSKQ